MLQDQLEQILALIRRRRPQSSNRILAGIGLALFLVFLLGHYLDFGGGFRVSRDDVEWESIWNGARDVFAL